MVGRLLPPKTPSKYTAFYNGVAVCQLVEYHQPKPVMLEYHHQKPVFLQDALYGKIIYGPSLWVCGNCHDAIHAWLYYLLGMHQKPPQIGRAAKAEAEKTYEWFTSELQRLELTWWNGKVIRPTTSTGQKVALTGTASSGNTTSVSFPNLTAWSAVTTRRNAASELARSAWQRLRQKLRT